MLEALKFVKGAVARKDFIPALQHFRIQHGHISSFNGTLGLRSPIAIDLDCAPKADAFIRAIEACKDTVALSLTETGRLLVRSGRFRTFVDTVEPSAFPHVLPEGKRVAVDDSLMPALRYLEPYIADDASRPWACGIMLSNESAFATNNIVLFEYWLGFQFPARINIPAAAVRELLRLGESPTSMQVSDNRATFHFDSGRWLTTQLDVNAWPETEALLSRESSQQNFPDGFFDALESIEPFLDEFGTVHFMGDRMATSAQPDKEGTTVELEGLPAAGCFNGRQLLRLKGAVDTIDFSSYPAPSLFYGPQARGLVVGIKTQ
jgi:DNA polymerase III sliding clamp (beta) subunit (PCNA family)